MKTNPLKDGALTENSTGLGTVTSKMVRERANELAVINGRTAQQVSRSDWDQAKRELLGELNSDVKEVAIEAAPESDRWNPVAGSAGRQVPAAPSDDEDAEGRSDKERLVEEGIAEAEHDQMLQAARDPNKRDT